MELSKTNSRIRYDYNRQRLRRQCREVLADHIRLKTNLNIPPAQVRLMNTEKYGYCWLRKPSAEHIFCRNLSKQTLAGYEQICLEVGINFEAVAVAAPSFGSQVSLEDPTMIQPAQQLSVSDGGSEIESIGTPEAMSNESMFQLLLSAHQGWVAERAALEKKECDLRAVRTEYERLIVKHRLTTDIMCKSLHALDAIATSVAGLREEISLSIQKIVLEKPE